MKLKFTLLALTLFISLFTGCTQQQPATPTPAPTATPTVAPTPNNKVDAVSAASIVDNAAAFEKSISKDGKWIICTTKDLSTDKELVLDGVFTNGKKDANGKDIIQRKIALYTQDDKRNVTARFTFKAPKLTINSPQASIQHGTWIGDVYVSVPNFQLVDATIEGNVYFATEEAKSTFKMDDKSKVTGKQEVKAK